MKHILLVEDDLQLGQMIENQLSSSGFLVTRIRSIEQSLMVDIFRFQLAIVDWELLDGEGTTLVKKWKALRPSLPAIMLTARNSLESRLEATENGVDDFIGKPFHFHELLGRIQFLLRKKNTGLTQSTSEQQAKPLLTAAGITLDPLSMEVTYLGDKKSLTKMEWTLLKFLMENPNRVYTREELLDMVWGPLGNSTNRTVDTHILQLRKKFSPELFETVWGTGYRFRSQNAK